MRARRAGRRRRRSAAVAVASVAMLAVTVGHAVGDSATSWDPAVALTAVPALDADVADPAIVTVFDGVVVLATNTTTDRGPMNVPAWRWLPSDGWHLVGDALPQVGSWSRPGRVWAPGVRQLHDGRWYLYYTSVDVDSGRQCIGRAVGLGPSGPFEDASTGPVICEPAEGGSIDASVHRQGPDAWLLWKSDGNAIGRPSAIKSVRLTHDGYPSGPVSMLLASGARWERGVVENPELVAAAGGPVLLYSGGRYGDDTYAIGAARCAGPAGPCTRTTAGPVLSTWAGPVPGVRGPGGASVTVDAHGTPQMAFHAWSGAVGYRSGGRRALHTAPIDVDEGRIRLRLARAPVGRTDPRPRITTRSTPTPVGALDDTSRFGGAGGHFLACDLGGTGTDAVVWFRDGAWHRSDLPVQAPASRTVFGQAGDEPLCGDFDGDGDDDRVVRRGDRFLLGPEVRGRHPEVVHLGRADDAALVGDWDGDGDADPGVFGGGTFTLQAAPGDVRRVRFGPSGSRPVVGDWDGDGATDLGVRTRREHHLRIAGLQTVVVPIGSTRSIPLAGRWDGGVVDSVGVVDR
jgi:hypothetical protein